MVTQRFVLTETIEHPATVRFGQCVCAGANPSMPRHFIEITTTEDGRLEIRASHVLTIEAVASNVVKLGLRD